MTSALGPCLIVCVRGVKTADTSRRLLTQLEFQMTATLHHVRIAVHVYTDQPLSVC